MTWSVSGVSKSYNDTWADTHENAFSILDEYDSALLSSMSLYERTKNATTKCVLRSKRRSTAKNKLPAVPGKEMWGVLVDLLVYHPPPNASQSFLWQANAVLMQPCSWHKHHLAARSTHDSALGRHLPNACRVHLHAVQWAFLDFQVFEVLQLIKVWRLLLLMFFFFASSIQLSAPEWCFFSQSLEVFTSLCQAHKAESLHTSTHRGSFLQVYWPIRTSSASARKNKHKFKN